MAVESDWDNAILRILEHSAAMESGICELLNVSQDSVNAAMHVALQNLRNNRDLLERTMFDRTVILQPDEIVVNFEDSIDTVIAAITAEEE